MVTKSLTGYVHTDNILHTVKLHVDRYTSPFKIFNTPQNVDLGPHMCHSVDFVVCGTAT